MNDPQGNYRIQAIAPSYEPTEADSELYRQALKSSFTMQAWNTGKAFSVMQLKSAGNKDFEIAWLAALAYTAGKIDGKREERRRNSKRALQPN